MAGARKRDALLLAAGELTRILGAAVRQPDELQQLGDARAHCVARSAAIDQAIRDVVEDREVREQRVRLEHDPVIALGRGQPRDVATMLDDAPGILRFEAGDDPKQRRLAAAGRAEEADELARIDR